MSSRDHHQPCACGAELADECPRCARTNPLGSMRIRADDEALYRHAGGQDRQDRAPERFPSPPCLDPECDRLRSWQRGLCKDHFLAHRKAGTLDAIALAPSQRARRTIGDRWLDYAGYVMTYTDQGVEPEHRYAMRKALGRALVKGENVHHVNGNRADNRLENLELWFAPQPAGQRVEQLLPYVAKFHKNAVLALIASEESSA